MERKKDNPLTQSLGICQRLYNFIINSIAPQISLKHILMMDPPKEYAGLVEIPITDSSKHRKVDKNQARGTKEDTDLYPSAQDVGIGQVGLSSSPKQIEPEKDQTVVVPPSATDSKAKSTKKIVSFRDAVEVISKEKEKKISKEKLTKGKDSRPVLKPILRVASNINEKSDAYIKSRKESIRRSSSGTDPKAISS
ncbi:hypothetical protein NE237_013897 [Protea cynaroides]|uniref:Uncharacterized protein n=1 Tax=Protea cynaroides TaxID=273540 RepID=A0A9Q0H4S2_9MAGN|nr:hypothetical protein NE237_013897 [Protea cynaroides]